MKVKFLPQNIEVEGKSGKSIMELAREHSLPVSASCNGVCVCAECKVQVMEGERAVLPPTLKELELIGDGYSIDNRRLACQLYCFGNVTINLNEQLEREKSLGKIKKQFLKKINKSSFEDSYSVGGLLLDEGSSQEAGTLQNPSQQETGPDQAQLSEHNNKRENHFKEGKKKFNKHHHNTAKKSRSSYFKSSGRRRK